MKPYIALAVGLACLVGCGPQPDPPKIVMPPQQVELHNPPPPEEIERPPMVVPPPTQSVDKPQVESIYHTKATHKTGQRVASSPDGMYLIDSSQARDGGPTALYRQDGTLLWQTEPGIRLSAVEVQSDTLYVTAENTLVALSTTGEDARYLAFGVTDFTLGDGVVYGIINNQLSWFFPENPEEITPIWQDNALERLVSYDPIPGGDVLVETATDTESHLYRYRLGGILEMMSPNLLPLFVDGDRFYSLQDIEGALHLCHVDLEAQTVTPAYPWPEPFDTDATIQNGTAFVTQWQNNAIEVFTLDLATAAVNHLATYETVSGNFVLDCVGFLTRGYLTDDFVYLTGRANCNGRETCTRLPLDGGPEKAFYEGQWMSATQLENSYYNLEE